MSFVKKTPDRPIVGSSSSTIKPEIVLDLSRLLSRVFHATPTGVDRCEMAYARSLLATVPDSLSFAAVHPFAGYGRLPTNAVHKFLDLTEERWEHRGFASAWDRRWFAIGAMRGLWPQRALPSNGNRATVFIQASPNNLARPKTIQDILRRERARFVCLVHDLIPLQYPEYARPGGADDHERRMTTIATLASGIVANSQATLTALQPYIDRSGRSPLTAVAHLGTDYRSDLKPVNEVRPYFVCIGTIEPRKNHLLLLNVWRQMSERHGAHAIPKLLVIGRRGWENEQVVDMLERCGALRGCVEERSDLPDREVQGLLKHSCGLLMPSFAEGYGMPVSEAIALSVPVVCSDLPALREAGSNVPLFLNPLDGPAWQAAITDLASQPSSEREQQVLRAAVTKLQTWKQHVAILLDLVHKVA